MLAEERDRLAQRMAAASAAKTRARVHGSWVRHDLADLPGPRETMRSRRRQDAAQSQSLSAAHEQQAGDLQCDPLQAFLEERGAGCDFAQPSSRRHHRPSPVQGDAAGDAGPLHNNNHNDYHHNHGNVNRMVSEDPRVTDPDPRWTSTGQHRSYLRAPDLARERSFYRAARATSAAYGRELEVADYSANLAAVIPIGANGTG
jgi:hypothetical protein